MAKKVVLIKDNSGYTNNTKEIKPITGSKLADPLDLLKETNLPGYSKESGYNTYGESQYDEQLTPGYFQTDSKGDTPFQELRAQKQTRLDKWANAVPRLVSKIGIEVAKTPGYLYALGEAGLTEKTLAESMNNAWLDGLDKADQSVKDQFAIYTPKAVKEGNLWDNISSASFWTNEGVDGAGYLIAMMAPGAALKTLGTAGKLSKLGMSGSMAQKMETGAATMMNTTLEAMGEAKGTVDQLKGEFNQKIEVGEINPKTGNPWTPEEADLAINEAGKGVFMNNMALLLAPNYLMNKNLLGRFTPTKNTLSKVIDPATGAFKEIAPLTQKQILSNAAKTLGEGLFSEGFVEEAGQFSIENYHKKLAKGETDKGLLAGLADEYANALTTTDGQKAIFLGGVFGGISAIGGVKQDKQESKYVNKLSTILKDNYEGFSQSLDNLYQKDSEGNIVLDNNNNPVINDKEAIKKVANILLETKSSQLKDVYGMLGNKEAYDYISNQEFTRFALPYLQEEGGLEALNKHIDVLSKKLIETKKQQEGIDDNFNEVQYTTELKQKAKKLKDTYNSVNDYINTIDLPNKDNVEQYNKFIDKLKNSAFQEVSKQLFISDRIKELSNEVIQLEMGSANMLPQVQLDITKKKDQVEEYKKTLDKSIDNYKSLFDTKEQEQAFEEYKAEDEKLNKVILEKQEEVSDPAYQEKEKLKEYNKLSKDIDNAINEKDLDSYLAEADKKGLTNPKLLDKISAKRQAIKSNQGVITEETTEETLVLNADEAPVDESEEVVSTQYVESDGKMATTVYKTESGLDDGTDAGRERYFRYIEKNKVADKKLQIVTKKNNLALYNEILEDRPAAKEFESKNKDYKGIYTVLIDKDNQPIKVGGKLIYSTLTKNVEHLAPKIREKGQEDIDAFRTQLLVLTNPNSFLPIVNKSKGIPEFLPKIDGVRQSNSVIGTIVNSLDELTLDLATQKGYKVNGIPVDMGKLYSIDNQGRVLDLIPRKLDMNEIGLIKNLIEQELGLQEKTIDHPLDEVKKIISTESFKSPQYNVTVKDGNLVLGTKTITKEQYNPEELITALMDKRVNVDKDLANRGFNNEFQGPRLSEEGPNTFKTYKEYLLSGNNPMFGTDLRPKSELQFRNQYLTYSPEIITDELKNEDIVEETIILNDNTAPVIEETQPTKKKFERKSRGDRSLNRLVKPGEKLNQSEKNWFKSVLPNVNIELITGLIEKQSMGRFLSNGQVLLSDEATKGTLIHEAFHAVTQLYLSESEINALYNETAKIYPDKSRQELEEILAEDFVDYKNTNKVLNNQPKRNSIFRKLLQVIKDLLGLKVNTVEELYKRLDKGFYSKAKVVGVREFSSLNRDENKYKITSEKGSAFVKDVLDGMDVMFFDVIYENEKTPIAAGANKDKIFNILYDDFADMYESLTDAEQIKDYEYILDNWDGIVKLWEERINSQGFEFKDSTELENNEEEAISDDENKEQRSGEAFQEANLTSSKENMSSQSRLLIRSLKQVGKVNNLGLEVPVDFNSTYNYILKNVAGIGSSYVDLYNKLVELSEVRPELKELTERLGAPSSDIDAAHIEFQTQFLQDFNKTRTNSLITVIRPDGTIQVLDATRLNETERVKTIWDNNLKLAAKQVDNQLKVDSSVSNIKDDIEFLNELGISFHSNTIEKIKSPDFDTRKFNQSVTELRNYVKDKNYNVTKLFNFGENIGGRMRYLLNLEATNTPNVNELSFISAEGKTVYSIGENNGISIIANTINNSISKEDLFNKLPHLNTVGAEGSYWISKLFNEDGSRNKENKISVNLYDGVQTMDDKDSIDERSSTRKLEIGDLFVQQLNSTLLEGKTSYVVSADKSSEFAISLEGKSKLPIDIETFKNGFDSIKLSLIFKNYFKSEFTRIAKFELDGLGADIDVYNKNGGKFTIFEFLPTDLKKEALNKIKELKEDNKSYNDSIEELNATLQSILPKINVSKFFDAKFTSTKNKLNYYKVLDKNNGIAKELLDKGYSQDQLIRAFIANDMINSIEQVKLFIGDMAFYKDLYKRTAGLAGTKQLGRNDEFFNEYLNKNNKRKDKKQADSKINVAIFDDVKVVKEDLKEYTEALIASRVDESLIDDVLSSYKKMDEGDAQGWITLDEYREFYKRIGTWSPMQEKVFEKMQSGEKLSKDELEVIFKVIKAQYFGPQVYNELYAPAYHKFSLLPLIPQLVAGKNMEKVLEHMTDNQVGYALFKSGSKVGTPVDKMGKANQFYTKGNHGEINTGNWNLQTVNYQFLGIQTKVSDPHDKVIFGTQFRKLLFSGAFENGKETFDGAKELFDEYSNIISNKIEREKAKLIKDLGLNTENYTIEDATKLVKLLQDAAKERNLADNIIDALDIEELEGKKIIKYSIDSMVNKAKIDSMLMALVNSRLIKQKVNGDAYVQGASSGFETIGKRDIGTNPELKFYRKGEDGKTLPMEVMIPISTNYYPLLKKYGSLEKLNEAIKAGDVNSKSLELVGYRIPTQGLNSIEFMTVREFIPEASATLIILPTAIVAKSGGDYDVDKLNVFRPSLNSKGEFITSKTEDEIGAIYDKLVDKEIEKVIGKSDTEVDKLLGDIFGEDLVLTAEDINEIVTEAKLPSKEQFIKEYNQSKSEQNRIIEISKEILSNESNFAALITPNSSSIMTAVADDIKYQKHVNDKNRKGEKPMPKDKYLETLDQKNNIKYTDQLDIVKKVEARYKLWLAKDEVGPAAIANVYHTLSQIANLKLNKSYTKGGEVVDVTINLPHHETKDNKIDLAKSKDVDGKNSLSEVLNQTINIVVDAAKEEEPIVNHLNMTMDTLPVYLYLNKMGVPFEVIAKFMTQPIINDYLQEVNINSANFLKSKKSSLSNKKIETKVKSKYGKLEEGYTPTEFNLDTLNKYQDESNQSGKEFNEHQLQILNDFLAYKEQAGLFGEAVKATNYDTAGLGQNINASHLKLEDVEKVKETNFVEGIDNILNTFIGSFDQNQFAIDAYKSLYKTQAPKISANTLNLFNKIESANFKKLSGKDRLKIINLIENDFINYVTQNYGYDNVNELQNRIFKTDSVAKRLGDLKNKSNKTKQEQEFLDNVLVRELFPIMRTSSKDVDNVKIYSKRFDTFTANQLTEAFRELKQMDLPFAQQFTKDLMDLGILQSGLNNSPITYLGIIPFEYYNELVKKGFKKFDKKNGADELYKFNQLFIRNNYKDGNIKNLAKSLELGDFVIEDKETESIKEVKNGLGLGMYIKYYDNTKYYSPKLKTVQQPQYSRLSTNSNITAIPLKNANFDNTELYRQYNLLNKYGKIKIVKNDTETAKWLDTLNLSPDYSFRLRNTLGGKRILIFNKDANQTSLFDNNSKSSFGKVESKEVLTPILDSLKGRFNLDYEFIDDDSLDWAGQYNGEKVLINLAKATLDTPFHEFAHPFVRIIKNDNLPNYLKLAKEIRDTKEGKFILEEVKRLYPELSSSDQMEEAIVTVIGLYAGGQVKSKSLIARITDFLNAILEKLGLKSINPKDLPNMTLKELGALMASDIKVDVSKAVIKEGELSFSKKEEKSAFIKQELYLQGRIRDLNKKLKTLKEGTAEHIKLKESIEELESKFETAKTEQSDDLFYELGKETLSGVERFIDELEQGTSRDTAENIEHTMDVLNTWIGFPELESYAARLLRRVIPFVNEFSLNKINEFATEKGGITQEMIDAQDEDIRTFKAGTGSLSDLPNYIARTIGSIIKAAQNRVETKNKKDAKAIQKEVEDLNSYAKKNGAKLEDMWKILTQSNKGTLILAKEYNEDGTENKNWNKIQKTPALKKFYDFYQESIVATQENLPIALGKNFIPNIKKSDLKSKIKGLSPIRNRKVGEGFEEDNIPDILSLEYNKPIPAEEKSNDLGTSLLQFTMFSNNFNEMSDVLPTVRILEKQLKYKFSNGKIVNREFKKSSNPNLTVDGDKSNLAKMINTIIDMQVLGKMKLEQGVFKVNSFIDENGNQIDKVIDGTKLADTLLRYNSLLRIGLSPITAISNVIFGDIANVMESVGGQFFNANNLRQATNIFFKQTFKEESTLNTLLQELNPLQEMDDYELLEKTRLTGEVAKMSPEKLMEYMYAPQKKGEKFLQSRTMLAILIKDGYLTPQGEITESYNNLTAKEKEQLSDKIQRLNQKIHGRYTTKESAALSQNVLYRLASQFRKWIPAAIENRIGTKQYDNRLQTEIEGTYLTFGRLVLKNWRNPKEAFENILLPLFASKKLLEEGKMTESEIYNMRKMSMEMVTIATLTLLYAALHGGDADEDKKFRKNALVKTGLTLLNRASGDLTFFYSPEQLNTLTKNAIPLSKTIGDIIQAVKVIPATLYSGDYTIKKGSSKGRNKIVKEIGDVLPLAKPLGDIGRLLSDSELEELK